MILFLEDWKLYPNCIADTKTTNQSFLRLAALYRDMGVKNHLFILQLHNRELQGVDPFSPNLTIEQIAMIAIECKTNFFYFIREIARSPDSTEENVIQFKANRGNIALFWLFFNHIVQILVQPRQTGKSFSTDVLMTYLLNIRCTGTQINLLTKDDIVRTSNLNRLKNIELTLPYFLKQRGRNDIGNTEELTVKSLGNAYRGLLPNKSPKMALNVGRGLTSPIFQIDEAAFLPNIAISMPAALAAGIAARETAKRKGDPYGTILTTTAGKKDDPDGRYVHDFMTNAAVWSDIFLDSNDTEELELIVRKNSPSGDLRVNCTFSYKQLGYTDAWLREVLETTNAKGEDADRDLFNVWTAGSQLSPFTVAITERIRKSQKLDYYTEISKQHGYITRWYVSEDLINHRMSNSDYIMGMDTSDAAGGDDIFMSIRDIRTGEIVAAGNYNETNLITFCEWLVVWFVRFPRLTLIIERRSTGAMIIDYLLLMLPTREIDPFKRIYNKAVHEHEEYPDRYKEISKPSYGGMGERLVKYKKLFGFATSGTGLSSRTELYSTTLNNAAKLTADMVNDGVLIDQLLGLITKNGRVDHQEGKHDDGVITWLLSMWLMLQSKNLQHYGISSKDILIDNKTSLEINNPAQQYENNQQNFLRRSIESLIKELETEKNEYVGYKIENKLRVLAGQLSEDDRRTLSLDDLVNSIKDSKRSFNRSQRY